MDSKGVQRSLGDDGNVLYPGVETMVIGSRYICQANSLTCLYLKYNVQVSADGKCTSIKACFFLK